MSSTKGKQWSDEQVTTKERQKVEEPPRYKVLLHNDDYTTMDFVVLVLKTIFNKDIGTATQIMLNVHHQGIGVAGIYPRDIAETKVEMVHELAKKNDHPLRCSLEKE